MDQILSPNHWTFAEYKQRITRKEAKELLLNGTDSIIYKGRLVQLKIKHIGLGVYEISKEVPKDTL